MPDDRPNADADLAGLEAALPSMRADLHRYCARMTGSVIEGEDVLQETLLHAIRALRQGATVSDLRSWLFRIAHNVAIDLFRARDREAAMKRAMGDVPAPDHDGSGRPVIRDVLRPFLRLTPQQRSAVILRDVFGYSAAQVADLTGGSVASVKSTLHRARARLKRVVSEDAPQSLPPPERQQLARYASCFNAHEFDRLRDMLTEEVRLELVAREHRRGLAGVGGYYANYRKRPDWRMAPGAVEGRPAILVFDPDDPTGPPQYFILLELRNGAVQSIRDFRYARYVMADAVWQCLESGERSWQPSDPFSVGKLPREQRK